MLDGGIECAFLALVAFSTNSVCRRRNASEAECDQIIKELFSLHFVSKLNFSTAPVGAAVIPFRGRPPGVKHDEADVSDYGGWSISVEHDRADIRSPQHRGGMAVPKWLSCFQSVKPAYFDKSPEGLQLRPSCT